MAALWSVWDISLISHPYFAVEDEREREREDATPLQINMFRHVFVVLLCCAVFGQLYQMCILICLVMYSWLWRTQCYCAKSPENRFEYKCQLGFISLVENPQKRPSLFNLRSMS